MLMAMTMTAATLALSACSNEDETNEVDLTKPIVLNIGLTAEQTDTRVTIDKDAAFESNDEVGLYMGAVQGASGTASELGSGEYNNVKYKASGSTGSMSWTGDPIYWQSTTGYHTFYAYSPYNKTVNASTTAINFTLPQDQSNAANYKKVDFLWKKIYDVQASKNALPLNLEHRMALIMLELQAGQDISGSDLTSMSVAINASSSHDIAADGTFDLKEGTCKAAGTQSSPALSTITPYRTGNTCYAIVMPETTFVKGAAFVTLTLNGTPYVYYLNTSDDIRIENGKKYSFTLTANKVGVDLSSFTIKAWTDGVTANGDADMDIH